jgi:hypothetical protein
MASDGETGAAPTLSSEKLIKADPAESVYGIPGGAATLVSYDHVRVANLRPRSSRQRNTAAARIDPVLAVANRIEERFEGVNE